MNMDGKLISNPQVKINKTSERTNEKSVYRGGEQKEK